MGGVFSAGNECGTDRETNLNVVGYRWMLVLGKLNERSISIEKVREAVNETTSVKAPGLDGFPVECLKKSSVLTYSKIKS